jgi:hypothetical protein
MIAGAERLTELCGCPVCAAGGNYLNRALDFDGLDSINNGWGGEGGGYQGIKQQHQKITGASPKKFCPDTRIHLRNLIRINENKSTLDGKSISLKSNGLG